MPSMKPITIAGGGLAGLFLGIQLRRRHIPVRIQEAGHYPRHRVCGEFINGQGVDILRRQGLIPLLQKVGARWAHTVRFHSRRHAADLNHLPEPALCLPRHELDSTLARLFVEAGGDLQCGQRVALPEDSQEGMVLATGRRRRSPRRGWRWIGLKCHAQDVDLAADLEMHFLRDAYVGLCQLGDGRVNVCGLFRRSAIRREPSLDPLEELQGPAGSLLRDRLRRASFDEASLCAVAGLDMNPYRSTRKGPCRLGDALAMIPPLTGNGMSMAFESAALAVEPLHRYSDGQWSWSESVAAIARDIDGAFERRLRWARRFQSFLLTSWGQATLLLGGARSANLWHWAFRQTR